VQSLNFWAKTALEALKLVSNHEFEAKFLDTEWITGATKLLGITRNRMWFLTGIARLA
jgi:hypothetical protein